MIPLIKTAFPHSINFGVFQIAVDENLLLLFGFMYLLMCPIMKKLCHIFISNKIDYMKIVPTWKMRIDFLISCRWYKKTWEDLP